MLEFFKKQLEDEPETSAEEYRERLFHTYAIMFKSFKKLHRTKGVSRDLKNELIDLDKRIENNEPSTLARIQILHKKVLDTSQTIGKNN